eukprot:GHVN01031647.1.p1 GENE.GHVN01031647.1~~GHVN01031647.1.p1  ORF type:complete len:198 (-),score=11.44 GHVN01031647.1:267-860(-)
MIIVSSRFLKTISQRTEQCLYAWGFYGPADAVMSSVAAPSKPEPRLLHCLKGHKGSVSNGQFTQNGNYFMSCGQDKTIRLWNPHKGLPIKDYKGPHNREVSGVSIYPDNSRFVSVGAEYAAFLWDVSTGRILRKFSGHEGKLYCCTLAPGAEVLLTGSYDKTVRLWDLKAHSSFKPIQTISDATDTLTRYDAERFNA